jgi:hypothetical protein
MITDCSFVKNICGIDCTGPSAVDRGRKSNKVSVIVDETGIPWGITFHKGNKSDAKAFYHTTQEIKKLQQPLSRITQKTFLGDRAYDCKQCDAVVNNMGWKNEVARRKCTKYEFSSIRVRVEHVFAWLDKYRRIVMRYERNITQYKSFTYLAMCHLISRRLKGFTMY